LSVGLFGAYDDAVLADQAGSSTTSPGTTTAAGGGFYSGLGVGLQYVPSQFNRLRAFANSALRYYPELGDLTSTAYQAGLELSAPLGRRVTVYASPRADYSSSYSLKLFPLPLPVDPEPVSATNPGATAPAVPAPSLPDIDNSLIQHDIYRYGGTTGANMSLTTQMSFGVDYAYWKNESDIASRDWETQQAGASFGYRVSNTASLELGYSRQEARQGADGKLTRAQNLDIGINYRKPLSRTRRTYLRFNTGTLLTDTEVVDAAGSVTDTVSITETDPVVETQSGERRRLRAVGSAALIHQMGRTWTAQGQYRRQLQYLDGFDEPIFADTVGVGLSGLVSRRLEFVLAASYVNGAVGLTRDAPRVETYAAVARLRRALARGLAVYAEYLFYHYRFDEDAARPVGLPLEFDRNGVRVGLVFWIPLMD
jgi:hypothetical protein